MDLKTQDVFRAADHILKTGVRPSGRKVLAFLGRGSYREITPALRLWWQEGGGARQVPLQAEPQPPLPRARGDLVTREEMEAAVALVSERADAERRVLMVETDRVRQELAAPLRLKIDRLENENMYLKARIAALERERH